jgi:ribonuclease G
LRRELLIAAGPGEWRAALLEDGLPVELFVERGDRSAAGSIHLGRVRRLVPALGAALVDIGGDRPAFLPQAEFVPRGKRVHEGERVLVQIRREAQGGKAARATMGVALRGPRVELIVGRPGVQDIEGLSPDERTRLSLALTHPASTLLPRKGGGEGEGAGASPPVIAGVGAERNDAGEDAVGLRLREPAPIDTLVAEAAILARRWRDILDRATRVDPPTRLDPTATFAAELAGAVSEGLSQILVDEPGAIPDIRAAFSDTSVEHVPETQWPIDLDGVFAEGMSETITLPGGGSVHFETTRAGTMIDVDTGTPESGSPERTGLAFNLAAADAIARQIRLRNLGGGIIIDFIGLDSRVARERVRAALAKSLAPDPARPQVLGWTRLGHFELVRPRRSRPLFEAMLEPRPGAALTRTALTVAHEALRALRRETLARPGRDWRLIVPPDVAAALAGAAAHAVKDAEVRFARKIAIEADPGYDRERFQIAPL